MTEVITIKEPVFYSYQDEKHFFSWIEGLKALKSMKRTPGGLELSLESPIDDASLVDLVALLTRYKIDRSALKAFLSPSNKKWFARSRAYWYRPVFRTASPR